MWHRLGRFGPLAALGAAVVLLGACVPPPPLPAPPVIVGFAIAGAPFSDPALVPFQWSVRDVNGDALTCRIDGDGDGTWDLTTSPCQLSGSRNLPAGEGDFTATFQVFDSSHPPVTATASYTVSAGPTETFDIEVFQIEPADPRLDVAIDEAVALWEAVIVRGIPDTYVRNEAGTGVCGDDAPGFDGLVDDVVVYIDVQPDVGAFGTATNCQTGPDILPRLSLIRLNEPSIEWFLTSGQLSDLIAHEMGHALGFTGYVWNTLVPNPASETPYFTGPRASAEYSALGGTGPVPVEPGTGIGHWDELTFQSELMTCYLENVADHPLSAITIGAMADIGYHVDVGAAQPYAIPATPGHRHC